MWQHKDGNTIIEGLGMFLLGINASTAKNIPNEMPVGLNATYFAEILEMPFGDLIHAAAGVPHIHVRQV